MSENKHSEQGRNSEMDKTAKAHQEGDAYANQGGGKLGSGNENSGHPANNVIAPERRHDANPGASAGIGKAPDSMDPGAALGARQRKEAAPSADVKGSGAPTLTGAGRLADDRPGRNDPKRDH